MSQKGRKLTMAVDWTNVDMPHAAIDKSCKKTNDFLLCDMTRALQQNSYTSAMLLTYPVFV